MKVCLLAVILIIGVEAVPRKKHALDQVGPISKRRVATRRLKEPVEKYHIDEPVDIPEVNKDLNLIEGDIMGPISRNTINGDRYSAYYWNTTSIPIEFLDKVGLLARGAIEEGRKEYEMRTCLRLVDRTDETSYIQFTATGGCSSYIGMQGGPQPISISPGCERIGTIEHEVMHALGIFHEQSRADRDDYIEIVWDKIREGTEGNFASYSFSDTDDRRVRYDYYSIMHYSKGGFSIDGNDTIVTRIPAFENVIGQRGGFSEDDVTKINRMYDCSDALRITNNVDFEDEAEGGYSQYGLNSDVEWNQHKLGISDTHGPTTRYLPTFDSTLGIEGEGSFMYLDTSVKFSGLSGVIKSMRYESTVEFQCLEFSYYMNLDPLSDAAITVYIASVDPVTGEITNYGKPLQTFTGDSGDEWSVHRMTISAPSLYKVVFYAKTSWYSNDVLAIDDVTVRDKECDTSYFMIENYSQQASEIAVDQYIESPLMYTDEGYTFKILVYPNGSQAAVDIGYTDYLSAYFQLCGGENDDELEWPFDKRYIRITVTDQSSNPTTRVNHNVIFMSEYNSSKNASWEKPAGVGICNPADGYRGFMRKEQFGRRMYLKHDVAYFSVQVSDLSVYEKQGMSRMINPMIRKRNSFQLEESNPDSPPSGKDAPPNIYEEPRHTTEGELMIDPAVEPQEEGMISMTTAAIIVLSVSFGVFFLMSLAICCVVSSYKKKAKARTVTNNINFVHLDTMKYSSLSGKI